MVFRLAAGAVAEVVVLLGLAKVAFLCLAALLFVLGIGAAAEESRVPRTEAIDSQYLVGHISVESFYRREF